MTEEPVRTARRVMENRVSAAKKYDKPLPSPSNVTRPFWSAAKKHEFAVQKCSACGTMNWYPKVWCVECGSRSFEWTSTKGEGKIYSYTVIRQVTTNSPAWNADVPFALLIVELDEGPRIVAPMIGNPREAAIDKRVRTEFVDATEEISIPSFRIVYEE